METVTDTEQGCNRRMVERYKINATYKFPLLLRKNKAKACQYDVYYTLWQ